MICGLSVCPGKNCPVYGEAGKTVGSQVKPGKLPAPDCWVKSGGLSGQPVINLTGSAKGCWNRMFCMISFFCGNRMVLVIVVYVYVAFWLVW